MEHSNTAGLGEVKKPSLIISSEYFTGISQITGASLAVILGLKRAIDALQISSSEQQISHTCRCGCWVCFDVRSLLLSS